MKHLFTFALLLSTLTTFAQYNDTIIAKPSSGYGADGTHTVSVISFPNPNYAFHPIQIYHPSDISTKVPTIFYSHAYGGTNPANISGLLNFVAQKGYAIVFVPYQSAATVSIADRYNTLLAGFRKAARDYPTIIDTTKVGFLGHSFGGGASFANAYACFTQNKWGKKGRFIYALAQWYTYISQNQLDSFPANTKLLTEVFDNDTTNDHRMAIDIFNHINIPTSEKDFLILKSDTINGYVYSAEHNMPNTASAFDALDYYAYYRLLDALCDYTFNGNTAGKKVALGNGSNVQTKMPSGLKRLVQTDNPVAIYPESNYIFPCSDSQNVRIAYCSGVLRPAEIPTSLETYDPKSPFNLYPNPAQTTLNVVLPEPLAEGELKIFNATGQWMLTQKITTSVFQIDVSTLPRGLYLMTLGNQQTKFMKE